MDRKRSNARNKNRSKRKKPSQENKPPDIVDNSVEEERQFKLRRFVKDVSKYFDGKEKPQVKVPKNGTMINMVQSKLCTRDDLKKEMKNRLDRNLRQIIGLENKKDDYSDCKCKQHCKSSIKKPVQKTTAPVVQEEQEPPNSPLLQISPSVSYNGIPSKDDTIPRTNENDLNTKSTISTLDLDLKLYPEFIRIVTYRCSKFKADCMNGLSYARPLKEKLKAIYKEKRYCCSDCPSDKPRSSVATSTSPASEPIRDNELPFIPNFVSDWKKYSTAQLFQETIGPGSAVSESYRGHEISSPDSYHIYPAPTPRPYRDQHLRANTEQTFYEPPDNEPLAPSFKYTQMTFDGGGDRLRLLNHNNIFLPPCDEESPEFKYFPRKIF